MGKTKRECHEQMAMGDLFILVVLTVMFSFKLVQNWVESDWLPFIGFLFLILLFLPFLAARIYHLTHKDKVFGDLDNKSIDNQER